MALTNDWANYSYPQDPYLHHPRKPSGLDSIPFDNEQLKKQYCGASSTPTLENQQVHDLFK